ncbi:MAG TPA: hypothetical protein VN554_02345 [Verrucomicrobiae bacterium]|nr:hypothetical protein [Verrucomicrobiae bacterium]
MRRYFIGLFIALGLIILLIILLLSGGKKPVTSGKRLVDYADTDAQVSMLIDGPVNAVSLHRQISITVDSTNVTYEALQGYDGDATDTQIFANTQSSYDAFLHALQHAGFSKGDNSPALKDERGYCPLGNRYIFELTQDGNTLQRYWTTSCGGNTPMSYLGSRNLTLTLFQAQVPGYSKLSQSVKF